VQSYGSTESMLWCRPEETSEGEVRGDFSKTKKQNTSVRRKGNRRVNPGRIAGAKSKTKGENLEKEGQGGGKERGDLLALSG